jgi:hypothetical protein
MVIFRIYCSYWHLIGHGKKCVDAVGMTSYDVSFLINFLKSEHFSIFFFLVAIHKQHSVLRVSEIIPKCNLALCSLQNSKTIPSLRFNEIYNLVTADFLLSFI